MFKYHMTPGKGVCSNRRVPSYGGVFGQIVI